MKVGDLVKFGRINGHTTHLNNKTALYMGEAFIHRNDGVVVENHKVLIVGDTSPIIIDRGLLKHMRVINECR
tara:strand:+ start:196 stop:411 length:216 start_codon:yes stop_codon:yes gene_type:complete